MSLTQLLPKPPNCTVSGEILFQGENVLEMDAEAIRGVRGKGIAYIFQEPSSSLNPVFTGRLSDCRGGAIAPTRH
jgi:ABC-type microcin C transport system duplicated ATPase subunit YejF